MWNLSLMKRTFSSCGACRNCCHVFFCFVQLSNLFSRNFYYDATQQYRYSNFSDVFCLNCNLVNDAAVKQLVSRSSLKDEASAVTMAAHKIFLKNQIFTIIVSLNSLWYCSVVASGGARPRGLTPGQRSSEETSQQQRAVGYSVSDLTGLGIELRPPTSIATT